MDERVRLSRTLTKRTYTNVRTAISGTIMKMSAVNLPEIAKRKMRYPVIWQRFRTSMEKFTVSAV